MADPKEKGIADGTSQTESTSKIASGMSHSSGYVNVADLRSRAKLTKQANKNTEKIKNSSKHTEDEGVDTIFIVKGKDAERRVSISEKLQSFAPKKQKDTSVSENFPIPPLSSLDKNDSDHISNKSSHHTYGTRRVSRNGSGSSKRKPSDGGDSLSTASTLVRESLLIKKRLKIGQNVLIPAKSSSMGSDRRTSIDGSHNDSIYVNAKGFPPGQGTTVEERHGPYLFVLAKIVKLHFENYYVNYSVQRHDTQRIQKVDRESIITILADSTGESAAMIAASQKPAITDAQTMKRRWFDTACVITFCQFWRNFCNTFVGFCKDQANRFVTGKSPYRIEFHFTTVNFLVICSLVVAFLEKINHSFLPNEAEKAVAVILCIAWIALVAELIFELINRPQNYSLLLEGERAFVPSTVRYINRFHLVFELLALGFALPEWLRKMVNIGGAFDFATIAVEASVGSSTAVFISGHLKLVLSRLRLFGLFRHRRNYWIRLQSNDHDVDNDESDSNDNESTLRNASSISTALLLITSQRALLLLMFISSVIPFLAAPADGGRDGTMYQMTNYLDRINKQFINSTTVEECALFNKTVFSWLHAENYNMRDTSFAEEKNRIVWLKIDPPRCGWPDDGVLRNAQLSIPCSDWSSNDLTDLETSCDIRDSYLYMVSQRSDETATEVVYNLSETIANVAFRSFILQVTLLILGLFFLGILRSDAINLVIAPLRKMLRIVLLYSENPLVDGPTSECDDDNKDKDVVQSRMKNKQLGAYETEQLIAAISKITDLLRKCWGVAGAGIISANLARNKQCNNTVVFNPTVPGKRVHAIFGFAGIDDFSYLLRSLDKDVMSLINDVAQVVHNEVYRWGFGESGQCNRNLGASFLLVYRIGDCQEVFERHSAAKNVIFSLGGKKSAPVVNENETENVQLSSLPGINTFADRALLGLLKSFAGIHREKSIKAWENDYRLGAGVGAFSLGMSFGMDAGWAMEGAVGSSYKIDATYLSPHVNMASRMMAACKQYNLTILFTENVADLLSTEANNVIRHIDTVTVKGSSEPVRVYTYDARHNGNDFFLHKRSEKDADNDAMNCSSSIWKTDADLREMRSHITPEFLNSYQTGLSQYLNGSFEDAAKSLRHANELMIESVIDDGKIPNASALGSKLLDPNSTDEEVLYLRKEFGDGPCQTLIAFIERKNFQKPTDWRGVRKLTSK